MIFFSLPLPCGRGRITSQDVMRVRGSSLTIKHTPHPNPLPQGERELTARAEIQDASKHYASQRQSNNGEAGGGDRIGVQPVNFSIE